MASRLAGLLSDPSPLLTPGRRPPAAGLQWLELQADFSLNAVISPGNKLAASPGGIRRWADGLDLARLDKGREHGLTVTLELAGELYQRLAAQHMSQG
jgi:hypothetical protein